MNIGEVSRMVNMPVSTIRYYDNEGLFTSLKKDSAGNRVFLKEDLEQWIQGGYAPLAMLLKALRPKLLALGLGSDADAEIFRALCAKPLRERLMEALLRKDAPLADALMAPHLPASLSFSAKEIFHGLD